MHFVLILKTVSDTRMLLKVIGCVEIARIYLEMATQHKLKGVLRFILRDQNFIIIASPLIVYPSSSSLFFRSALINYLFIGKFILITT